MVPQWSAKQEAKYFVNLLFVLIVVIYLYLQIKIKGCSYLNSKSKEFHFIQEKLPTSFMYVPKYDLKAPPPKLPSIKK